MIDSGHLNHDTVVPTGITRTHINIVCQSILKGIHKPPPRIDFYLVPGVVTDLTLFGNRNALNEVGAIG